jgi:hypothetical protein
VRTILHTTVRTAGPERASRFVRPPAPRFIGLTEPRAVRYFPLCCLLQLCEVDIQDLGYSHCEAKSRLAAPSQVSNDRRLVRSDDPSDTGLGRGAAQSSRSTLPGCSNLPAHFGDKHFPFRAQLFHSAKTSAGARRALVSGGPISRHPRNVGTEELGTELSRVGQGKIIRRVQRESLADAPNEERVAWPSANHLIGPLHTGGFPAVLAPLRHAQWFPIHE